MNEKTQFTESELKHNWDEIFENKLKSLTITKGKWEAEQQKDGYSSWKVKKLSDDKGDWYETICDIKYANCNPFPEEAEANAKLIAFSPELLISLMVARKHIYKERFGVGMLINKYDKPAAIVGANRSCNYMDIVIKSILNIK